MADTTITKIDSTTSPTGVILEAGNSWLVPRGVSHRYRIPGTFTAVECTQTPARVNSRDA